MCDVTNAKDIVEELLQVGTEYYEASLFCVACIRLYFYFSFCMDNKKYLACH